MTPRTPETREPVQKTFALPRTGDEAGNIDHDYQGYPQLGLAVYIEGNCFLSGAISMFAKAGCYAAKNIEEAQLVCFLGGEDIDPSLYGEKALSCTYFNKNRDMREVMTFEECIEKSIPMFGICRGMQLLHALNGGKLYQDVRNHASGPHLIKDVQTGEELYATSMHHQMCIENDTTFVIAYAEGQGQDYRDASSILTSKKHRDLEAAVYPNINSFCVQGHPEVGGYPQYTIWCMTKLKEFLEELALMGDNTRERPLTEEIPMLNVGIDV